MKKPSLLIWSAVAIIVLLVNLYSCSKSDTYWSSTAAKSDSLSIGDARAWFQNEYSGDIADVKSLAGSSKTRLVSYARGVFAGEPDWNYHHLYRNNRNALMIPLDYADTSTRFRGFRDVVVVRNKTRKSFNAYVQLQIFNKSYLKSLFKSKGNLPDIRSYSDPATFTGEVLLFSINNEFIRGAVYTNGKVTARVFPKNGIGSMVKGIANSLESAKTYVRFNGGANLAAMTKEGDSKKVALNTAPRTASYEEAAAHTAATASDNGDTDSDGDTIWDGTDLGTVTVTSDPPDGGGYPGGGGLGDDSSPFDDSYPTGNDPAPSNPGSGGGGGSGGPSTSTVSFGPILKRLCAIYTWKKVGSSYNAVITPMYASEHNDAQGFTVNAVFNDVCITLPMYGINANNVNVEASQIINNAFNAAVANIHQKLNDGTLTNIYTDLQYKNALLPVIKSYLQQYNSAALFTPNAQATGVPVNAVNDNSFCNND